MIETRALRTVFRVFVALATAVCGSSSSQHRVTLSRRTAGWSTSRCTHSMGRDIPLQVLRPADTSTPAPTLYLLNGVDGGKDDATWSVRTDAPKFFADKHVNVVTPLGGAFSYYTDWERPDPGLAKSGNNNGVNMWTTFLTEELPPVIDSTFGTTGENALAGLSMAGTSVLDLAMAAPALYNSVGSFSGCAMTSPGIGQDFVKLVVAVGGGDAENMWGPYDGPGWPAHDPVVNADKLPRIPMYITTATGIPGPYDTLADPRIATTSQIWRCSLFSVAESRRQLTTAPPSLRTGRTHWV